MRVKYLTTTPRQTKKLGEILAKEVLKTKLKKGALIIGLEGDLGGGKTTFLQGFAKGLGIKNKILSPTFVIIKKFPITELPKEMKVKMRTKSSLPSKGRRADGVQFSNFYHIDCYRIKKPKEILDLGFKEIVKNPENIVAIEWAEKIRKTIPREAVWIKFEFIDKTARKIVLKWNNNQRGIGLIIIDSNSILLFIGPIMPHIV